MAGLLTGHLWLALLLLWGGLGRLAVLGPSSPGRLLGGAVLAEVSVLLTLPTLGGGGGCGSSSLLLLLASVARSSWSSVGGLLSWLLQLELPH